MRVSITNNLHKNKLKLAKPYNNHLLRSLTHNNNKANKANQHNNNNTTILACIFLEAVNQLNKQVNKSSTKNCNLSNKNKHPNHGFPTQPWQRSKTVKLPNIKTLTHPNSTQV